MEQTIVLSEIQCLIKENTDKILPTKSRAEGVIGARYHVDHATYAGWHAKALTFIKMFLPVDSDLIEKFVECTADYYSNAETANSILESIVEYIEKGFISLDDVSDFDTDKELKRLFARFHRVARQIRQRHDNRNTINIEDEYDVQDLLHALLKIYFDDVRPEEWTPSYAGKSARMDFLLKNENIVIEVKKTRQGLADKEIGDQLIVDIERYQSHPDCKKLVCFVYDPEGRIGNPDGLAADLMSQHTDFLTVIVEPTN